MYALTLGLIITISTGFLTCETEIFAVTKEENSTALQTLSTKSTENSIQCARSCKQLADCSAVRYNHTSRTCILFRTSYLNGTYSFTNSSGWITFRRHVCACEGGWALFESSCYYIPETTGNWKNSSDNCMHNNSHLVTITSANEGEFVLKLRNETIGDGFQLWIGGQNVSNSGTWGWTWGTGELWRYENWSGGQPSGANGNGIPQLCLRIDASNSWNDKICDRELHSMCEKPAVFLVA